MRWFVFATLVACHSTVIPPEPPNTRPDPRPDEVADVPPEVPADPLGARLQVVSQRIEAELLAEAGVPAIDQHARPVWPEPPDEADDAREPPAKGAARQREPRWLEALGPCVRPDAAAIRAMTQRMERWIVAKKIQYPDLGAAWGCVEPGGVIANFRVIGHTAADPETQSSFDWIVRVSSRIDVLFSVVGGDPEGGEWTPEASLEAVLYPVGDHHDVVAIREDHISGAIASSYTFEARVRGRPVTLARHSGTLQAAPWQPSPDVHVVGLGSEELEDVVNFRCLGPNDPLTRCPAALKVERWRRRVLAIDAMFDARDHETLATYLGLAEVPSAERAELLALTRPSTLLERIEDFKRERDRHAADLTEPERIAGYHAEAAALATRLRAALGARACTALTRQDERALRDATKRWIAGKHPPVDPDAEPNERNDCGPLELAKIERLEIGPACASDTHFTWVVHWSSWPAEPFDFCTHAAVFNAPRDLSEVHVARYYATVPIPAAGTSPARYDYVPMYVSDAWIIADVDGEAIVIQDVVAAETDRDLGLFGNTLLRQTGDGRVHFKRLDPAYTELMSFPAPAELPGSLAVVREPWPYEGSSELAELVIPIERKAFFDDYLTYHCRSETIDEAACALAFDEVRQR